MSLSSGTCSKLACVRFRTRVPDRSVVRFLGDIPLSPSARLTFVLMERASNHLIALVSSTSSSERNENIRPYFSSLDRTPLSLRCVSKLEQFLLPIEDDDPVTKVQNTRKKLGTSLRDRMRPDDTIFLSFFNSLVAIDSSIAKRKSDQQIKRKNFMEILIFDVFFHTMD